MVKFLIVGPVTHDTILTSGLKHQKIGGPAYYQASVLSSFKSEVTAVVTVGRGDSDLLKSFPRDINLLPVWGDETMEFENFYPDDDPNHRIQRACIPQNPIQTSHLHGIDVGSFDAVLVSPLSPFDVPLETLKYISKKGAPIYLGAQGYLRHFKGYEVVLKPWKRYKDFLRYVEFLFIDEVEASVMLGELQLSLDEILQDVSKHGPKEVIITRGSRGSVIYSQDSSEIYRIPAFPPKETVDPTGLGDTYLAAYAFKRQEVSDLRECGIFASLVSSSKLEKKGAFNGNRQQIQEKRSKLIF